MKKLCKDRVNKKLCGVCSGLAKYLDMDVTLIRLAFILLAVCFNVGMITYIICAIVMDEEPEYSQV